MWRKQNKEGFTLAELLIVVAIIGVLVAVSIPIFTSRLEKSREAADLANLRSAYAAGSYRLMDGDSDTGLEMQTYIYDPGSGKLLTFSEANSLGNDSSRLFCGKGTSAVGSKDNRQSVSWSGKEISRFAGSEKTMLKGGTSGMLYDPSQDVAGHAIVVSIYPPNHTVIVYFQ